MTILRKSAGTLCALLACFASTSALAHTDPSPFVHATPDEIRWVDTTSIPRGAQTAVVYGDRRIFSRFEKLDLMFIAFISFALIVDGLRWC